MCEHINQPGKKAFTDIYKKKMLHAGKCICTISYFYSISCEANTQEKAFNSSKRLVLRQHFSQQTFKRRRFISEPFAQGGQSGFASRLQEVAHFHIIYNLSSFLCSSTLYPVHWYYLTTINFNYLKLKPNKHNHASMEVFVRCWLL